MGKQKSVEFPAIFSNKICKLEKKNVRKQKSVEFPAIFSNKICKLEKKNVKRQKSVGIPAIFKKNLWNELWVRIVGHEMLIYLKCSVLSMPINCH